MVSPEACAFGPGEVCVFSTACPGNDAPNEDAAGAVTISETSGVLMVADGLGGLASGQVASKTAVEAMQSSLAGLPSESVLVRTAVLNGFELANERIRATLPTAATTIALVEIDGSKARPYCVGDSAVFVIGGRGKLKYQSIAQSPTGYGVEAGLINENEALAHAERHLVSNIVGSEDMHIDVGPVIALSPHDTVLLASDGLVDNLHAEEICAFARKGSLEHVVGRLADEALRRMTRTAETRPSKPDDLTIVGYRACR